MPNKIILSLDGSDYSDKICSLGAWLHKQSNLPIALLHVAAPHSEIEARPDMSGQIGYETRNILLDNLTKIDEEHGKAEHRKGHAILEQAQEKLANAGLDKLEVVHRRGDFVETLMELQEKAEIIIIGKKGEQHKIDDLEIGSNLERLARNIHKPLLIASNKITDIKKILIAYDGSSNADKAIEYIAQSPIFRTLECHLLKVGETSQESENIVGLAKEKLQQANLTVHTTIKAGKSVETTVNEYITNNNIDLLVIGSYGHSKIRTFILGSTTTALINKSTIPVMLFH